MAFSGKPYGFNPETKRFEPLSNISGLSNLYFVRVATTANLTTSYSSGVLTNTGTLAAISIDGVALSLNDKVLVKNQSTGTQNGLYSVTVVGDGSTAWTLTRSVDMDTSAEAEERDSFWVSEGSTNADNGFTLTTPGAITLDATALTFSRTLGSATGSGQPASAALTDLSDIGVVSAADKFFYSSATGVWAEGTITASGRATVALSWSSGTQVPSLTASGTAAYLTVGTGANNLIQNGSDGYLPVLDGRNLTNLPGSGSGESLSKTYTETAHALSIGNPVRYNGTNWVKSQGDSAANAEAFGIISATTTNTITVVMGGYISGLTGLTAGSAHFLDPATAGALTTTDPTTSGQVSKPILLGLTTTTGIVQIQRGYVIP